MEIVLTSLFNTPIHEQIRARGGRVYTAMISPFKGRPEPNIAMLAASRELVFGHKHGTGDMRWASFPVVSDAEYTTGYLQILDKRKTAIDDWMKKQQGDIALCCSCPGGIWGVQQFEKKNPGQQGTWNFCHLDVLEIWLWKQYGKSISVKRV